MNLSKPPPYTQSHNLLAGRKVIITAAAGTGIGFAVAKRCAEEGAALLISDIHERRLQDAANRLADETGVTPVTCLCNVTDQQDIDELFRSARDTFGAPDVVINNAGLGGTANIVEMTDEAWHQVLDITLNGTFRMTRAAMQAMSGSGGAIINNASVLGWRAQKGQAHYAAAKAGVMALTRCAGLEGAELGIRVNAVAPGPVWTPFIPGSMPDDMVADFGKQAPMGRAGQPWEIATSYLFLACDDGSYVTGQTLHPNGGYVVNA